MSTRAGRQQHRCASRERPLLQPKYSFSARKRSKSCLSTNSASKRKPLSQVAPSMGPSPSCASGRKESIPQGHRNETQHTLHHRGDFSEAFISLLTLGLQEAAAPRAALPCRNITPRNHNNPRTVSAWMVTPSSTHITQTYSTGTFTW